MHEVGYLVDSFDLLNVEHLDLVHQAARLCGSLVVGVVPDEMIIEFLGRPPVIPMEERLELVRQVRTVDRVVRHAAGTAPQGSLRLVASGEQFGVVPDVVLHARRVTASALLRRATARPTAEDDGEVSA